MERLTHERVNGIKTGYWSAATKEVLVQKLAAYENTGYEPDEIRAARRPDRRPGRLSGLRKRGRGAGRSDG